MRRQSRMKMKLANWVGRVSGDDNDRRAGHDHRPRRSPKGAKSGPEYGMNKHHPGTVPVLV